MGSPRRKPDDRLRRIEALGDLLAPLLADLSTLACPLCNSRLIDVRLQAHGGVIFVCSGEMDTACDNPALEPFRCTYRYRVKFQPTTRQAELFAVEVEAEP